MSERHRAACRRHYQRNKEYYRARNMQRRQYCRRFVLRVKSFACCSECGYDKHPAALDFHHKDGTKKQGNVASLISQGQISKVKAEMRKCVILCANCHRIEHSGIV